MTLNDTRRQIGRGMTGGLSRILAKTGITPNTVTVVGFLITLVAGYIISTGSLLAGGLVFLFSSFFDMLDGAVARATGRITKFGGILDAALDRLSEAAIFISIIVYYAPEANAWPLLLTGLTLAGSQVVSYIRARSEANGLEGKEGIFTRPERVVVLGIGLITGWLIPALAIICLLSFITIGQRLASAYRQLGGK
ncbi:CDP-alcohol phosphatidyltransferase family protein [Dehalogenimonas etheniformans]|uniref:CDP-alcohol phosphatidyltransferase family protein n=1 Tax=Dehalogenimonas etheniformans TaxID=1536648 RepID=A0A2P5P9W5_9CHLR|nr:CDP-alcohol phosphatidyltransferase family protein [Dehalogenimonas etheniformans]PPD59064.1 CDP-alcohol phosphatidyltransferase family protein [Dehalogenimonas etheniformans]QNT76512.1 CDP-alcohol phosphatidyltransferase family protein [Dehalogenimonas etheniformans]